MPLNCDGLETNKPASIKIVFLEYKFDCSCKFQMAFVIKNTV